VASATVRAVDHSFTIILSSPSITSAAAIAVTLPGHVMDRTLVRNRSSPTLDRGKIQVGRPYVFRFCWPP
jgi:hypothetical protein